MKNVNKTINLMINKSRANFIYAIETFNKPKLETKLDIFLFLICSAWELLLKSKLLKENKSIFYKDKKHKSRTISLKEALCKVIPDERDKIRINLETIIGFRNSAQHFIIPEYANFLNDIIIANVLNFIDKFKDFNGENLVDYFDNNFINIFIPHEYSKVEIVSKYGKDVYDNFIKKEKYINNLLDESLDAQNNVDKRIAITYNFKAQLVKRNADLTISNKYAKGKSPFNAVMISNENYKSVYPYTCSKIIKLVNERCQEENISFTPVSDKASKNFNKHTLQIYLKKYNIKNNREFSFELSTNDKNKSYLYSVNLLEKIISDLKSDPDIFIKK